MNHTTVMGKARARLGTTYSNAARLFKAYILRDPFERAAAQWFRLNGDATLRLDYPLDGNSVVFDCGGFEGDWAAAIHNKYRCPVFIFEPVKKFADAIAERFRDNPAITVLPFGLHSRDETSTIRLAGNASSVYGVGNTVETIRLRDVTHVLNELKIERIALMKINIEGGEFDLLDRLLESGSAALVDNFQIQFHRFVPDAVARRNAIRKQLASTHSLLYDFEFIWESWSRTQCLHTPNAAVDN